ncbi:hypothetical protein [Thiobacillus sp.]
MKSLAAAVLLATLGACSSGGADPVAKPAAPAVAGKSLPYAPPPPPMPEEGGACPADVRQCPDGSFASRNPTKDCAFEPCPGAGKP